MTNKITKEFLFTELSIKIATLEMKLDAILKLLNKPEITYEVSAPTVNVTGDITLEGAFKLYREHLDKSDNEKFDEDFK